MKYGAHVTWSIFMGIWSESTRVNM